MKCLIFVKELGLMQIWYEWVLEVIIELAINLFILDVDMVGVASQKILKH